MHLVQHIHAAHRIRNHQPPSHIRRGGPGADVGCLGDVVLAGAGEEDAGEASSGEFANGSGRVPAPAVAVADITVKVDGGVGVAVACAGALGRG